MSHDSLRNILAALALNYDIINFARFMEITVISQLEKYFLQTHNEGYTKEHQIYLLTIIIADDGTGGKLL